MTALDALRRFADDELVRAPMLADQLVEETMRVLEQECRHALSRAAQGLNDLMHALHERRGAFVREFVRTLDAHVRREFDRDFSVRHAEASAVDPGRAPPAPAGLALVDESQVEVDVEISRTIEAIGSTAEHELRELASFASALVGDREVTRDHNPLRPEAIARALWDAIPALCTQSAMQLAFMRHAADPLAQLMRRTYAGACARLEAMGIEPAIHRTVIIAGDRRPRRAGPLQPHARGAQAYGPASEAAARTGAAAAALQAIATTTTGARQADGTTEGSPSKSAADHTEPARIGPIEHLLHRLTADAEMRAPGASDEAAPTPPDERGHPSTGRQRVELVGRLFAIMLADPRLHEDVLALIARLQAPAQRLAFDQPELLDAHTHPIWLLLDRIALQGELHPPPGHPLRQRMLRHLNELVDALRRGQTQGREACAQAYRRLLAYERSRFEARHSAAEAERTSLQALEDRTADGAAPPTRPGALDVGQLDTVPAELLGDPELVDCDPGDLADEAGWLSGLHEGDWLRLFMQGRWPHAQLLWRGPHREYWLLAEGVSDRTWAIRRRALERMREARLLTRVEPRSLVREAAQHALRRLDH